MKVDGDGVIDLLDSSDESSSSDGAPMAAPPAVQRPMVTARKAASRALPAPTGNRVWAASSSESDDESKSKEASSSEDLQAGKMAARVRQKRQLQLQQQQKWKQKQKQNVRSSYAVRAQISRRRKRRHSSEEESEAKSEEESEAESKEESEEKSEDESESEDERRVRKRRSPAKKKLRVVESPAPSKQPRTTKAPASRSRNGSDIRQLAEGMPFSELQAQEQAMAHFQAQNVRRVSRPATAKSTSSPKARHAPKSPAPHATEHAAGNDTSETRKYSESVLYTELHVQQQAMERFSSQKSRRALRPAPKPRGVDDSGEESQSNRSEDSGGMTMTVVRRAKPVHAERPRKRSTKLKKVDESEDSDESDGSWGEEKEEGSAQENQAPPRNRINFSRKPRVASRTADAVKQHAVAKTPPLYAARGSSSASGAMRELVESMSTGQLPVQEKAIRQFQAPKFHKATSRPAAKCRGSSFSEAEDEKSEEDDPLKPRKVAVQVSVERHQRRSAEKHAPTDQAARPSASAEDLADATFHGMQLISETMSLSELQAQERALRSFQKQKKRRQVGAVSTARNGQHPGHMRKSNGSAGRRTRMGAQMKLAEPPSTTTFVSTPSRNGFSAPMVDQTPSASNTQSFESARAAPNPVVHSTAWRRLCFLEAPSNILQGVATSPYASGGDKPLWDYDPTGSLKEDCNFVPTTNNVGLQDIAQVQVNAQVRETVERELPTIRECHARRVREILKGTRTELVEYFQVHREVREETFRRLQWSELANLQTSVQASPVERAAAQRLQREPVRPEPLNGLVGIVRYFVRRGESQFERLVYPETVTHLSNDITSLRRSFTMIGVRKNPFVEGDPVLRYVPYLGDNAQLGIDRHRYTGTTMDKQRRITELGGDCGESCGGKCSELKAIKPSARDDEIQECLLRVVVTKCGGSKQVFRVLKHEAGFDRPLSDYNEMKNVYMAERRTEKRLAEVQRLIACPRGSPPANDGAAVSQVRLSSVLQKLTRPSWFLREPTESRSLTERLLPPMSSFESNYAECPEADGIRNRTSYDGLIEWHRDLFCRRCFTYDCNEHGVQNPRPSRREDPINPVVSVSGIVLQSRELGTQGGEFSINDDQENEKDEGIPAGAAEVIDLLESGSSSDNESLASLSKLSGKTQETSETPNCRRSRRSQTRISSMASANLVEQEKMQERGRLVEQEKKKKMRQKFTRSVYNSEYLDDSYLPVVKDMMKTVLSKTTACSSTCWKTVTASNTPLGRELSPLDAVLVRKLASMFANNACVVSRMLKRSGCTCAQIKAFLEKETKRRDSGEGVEVEEGMVAPEDRREKQGRRQSGAAAGGKRSLAKRGREQRSNGVEKTLSFKPCNHEGTCDGCDCVQRGHKCNKTCSCARDCPNRFQGCHCPMGSCRSSSCPCWSADRECDPDYCFSCGATDAAVMVFHPTFKAQSSYNVGICCNVNLLRGYTQKKVGIAFSATHGWGAFALEPIRKDEFVMEYTGSLISDDEAERRGAVYDRLSVSYLFNVNNDEVVDAARQGNKAKFANHRLLDEANMKVKILVVNGEHRIGLFASESIELGAELFFDYSYTHDTAPQWSQLRQNGAPRPLWTVDDDDDYEWDWE